MHRSLFRRIYTPAVAYPNSTCMIFTKGKDAFLFQAQFFTCIMRHLHRRRHHIQTILKISDPDIPVDFPDTGDRNSRMRIDRNKNRHILIENRTALIFRSHPELLGLFIPIQTMNPLALYTLRMIIRNINRKILRTTALIIQTAIQRTYPDPLFPIGIHRCYRIITKRMRIERIIFDISTAPGQHIIDIDTIIRTHPQFLLLGHHQATEHYLIHFRKIMQGKCFRIHIIFQ